MNGDRFFLDTNIFVYALQPDGSAKASRARELIRTAGSSNRGAVSYQVVQEFFNVALRKFQPPLQTGDAAQFLRRVFLPLLEVEPTESLMVGALHVHDRYRLSWYDALIVAAAGKARCRLLYSEDFQHGQEFDGVRVVDPFR
jgi:predicted nucleic acid-binding protein